MAKLAQANAQPGAKDRQFIAMLDGYRASGGLARRQEVAAEFSRLGLALATLARQLAYQQVISFYWQSQVWLPLFQFNRSDMSLKPGLWRVIDELQCLHDRWELANWFVRPHPLLAQRTPVESFECDCDCGCGCVWHAACTDRRAA
jgi:hypothetical protein